MITFQKQHCDEGLIYMMLLWLVQVPSHLNVTVKAEALAMIQPYKRDYENHPINNWKKNNISEERKKKWKLLLFKRHWRDKICTKWQDNKLSILFLIIIMEKKKIFKPSLSNSLYSLNNCFLFKSESAD